MFYLLLFWGSVVLCYPLLPRLRVPCQTNKTGPNNEINDAISLFRFFHCLSLPVLGLLVWQGTRNLGERMINNDHIIFGALFYSPKDYMVGRCLSLVSSFVVSYSPGLFIIWAPTLSLFPNNKRALGEYETDNEI